MAPSGFGSPPAPHLRGSLLRVASRAARARPATYPWPRRGAQVASAGSFLTPFKLGFPGSEESRQQTPGVLYAPSPASPRPTPSPPWLGRLQQTGRGVAQSRAEQPPARALRSRSSFAPEGRASSVEQRVFPPHRRERALLGTLQAGRVSGWDSDPLNLGWGSEERIKGFPPVQTTAFKSKTTGRSPSPA